MIAINDLAYMAGVIVQVVLIITQNYLQQLHRLIQSHLDSQPIPKEGK